MKFFGDIKRLTSKVMSSDGSSNIIILAFLSTIRCFVAASFLKACYNRRLFRVNEPFAGICLPAPRSERVGFSCRSGKIPDNPTALFGESEMKKLLAPSILSCDYLNLEKEVNAVGQAGADLIHVDVMDGHFVPNISIGIPIVEAVARMESPPQMDIHLMIDDPEKFTEKFIDAGSPHVKIVTVQMEACNLLYSALSSIRWRGVMAGVALNPATPIGVIEEKLMELIDVIVIMTVEPGFGGQKFIPEMLSKISYLRTLLDGMDGKKPLIEADGGINLENIGEVIEAGADIVVTGSGIFKTKNYADTMSAMREIMG